MYTVNVTLACYMHLISAGPPSAALVLQPRDAGQGGAAVHPRGLRHVCGLQRPAGPGAGHYHHDRKRAGGRGGGSRRVQGGSPRPGVAATSW